MPTLRSAMKPDLPSPFDAFSPAVPATAADFLTFVAQVDREYGVSNPQYDYKENWTELLTAAREEYAEQAKLALPLPVDIDARIVRAVDEYVAQGGAR